MGLITVRCNILSTDTFKCLLIVLFAVTFRVRVVTELDSSHRILCRGSDQESECGRLSRVCQATEGEAIWPWENRRHEHVITLTPVLQTRFWKSPLKIAGVIFFWSTNQFRNSSSINRIIIAALVPRETVSSICGVNPEPSTGWGVGGGGWSQSQPSVGELCVHPGWVGC